MIDTAADYGSQPGIGEALDSTGVDRSEIYLVAKVEEDPPVPGDSIEHAGTAA
jgi:diketogulonate reductase-like aldo/keto reductase